MGSVTGSREASSGTLMWGGADDMRASLGDRLAEQRGDLGIDGDDLVVLVYVHDPRGVVLQVVGVVDPVGDDDDRVAPVDEPGGGAVDLHLTRAGLPGDRVG